MFCFGLSNEKKVRSRTLSDKKLFTPSSIKAFQKKPTIAKVSIEVDIPYLLQTLYICNVILNDKNILRKAISKNVKKLSCEYERKKQYFFDV